MEQFRAIPYSKKEEYTNSIDVSSKGEKPYNSFSPFTFSSDFKIPVPGQVDVYANSVESIWQGLKIINSLPDFSLFNSKPKKRKGNVDGHLYGSTIIDYIDARNCIFKNTYNHYLENYISKDLKEDILTKGLDSKLFFYDVGENLDINDESAPFSHSKLVANYFNKLLSEREKIVDKEITRIVNIPSASFYTLSNAIGDGMRFYNNLSKLDQKIMLKHLRNHPLKGKYSDRLYIKLAHKIEGVIS